MADNARFHAGGSEFKYLFDYCEPFFRRIEKQYGKSDDEKNLNRIALIRAALDKAELKLGMKALEAHDWITVSKSIEYLVNNIPASPVLIQLKSEYEKTAQVRTQEASVNQAAAEKKRKMEEAAEKKQEMKIKAQEEKESKAAEAAKAAKKALYAKYLPQCKNVIMDRLQLLRSNPYAISGQCIHLSIFNFQFTSETSGLFYYANNKLGYFEFPSSITTKSIVVIAKVNGRFSYENRVGVTNEVPKFDVLAVEGE